MFTLHIIIQRPLDSIIFLSQISHIFCEFKFTATPLCTHVPSYPDTVQGIDNSTLCWTVNYTCVSEMYFEDGSFSNLLQCKGGQSLANGTWVGTVPQCVGPTTTDSVETTTLEETTTQTTECICPV